MLAFRLLAGLSDSSLPIVHQRDRFGAPAKSFLPQSVAPCCAVSLVSSRVFLRTSQKYRELVIALLLGLGFIRDSAATRLVRNSRGKMFTLIVFPTNSLRFLHTEAGWSKLRSVRSSDRSQFDAHQSKSRTAWYHRFRRIDPTNKGA